MSETDKARDEPGDDIRLSVRGQALKAINALNLILPYSEKEMTFTRIEPLAVKDMQNMTNDRLHKDGSKVLYPTFVNIGDQPILNGDTPLFVIHFKALRRVKLPQVKFDALLVSKSLETIEQ